MDKRKVLRGVALGLQIAAMAMYFIVPLFFGGWVGVPWLILGVVNAAVFCAIFYRTSGVVWRFVVGIILTVCTAVWNIGLVLIVIAISAIAGIYGWSGGVGLNLYMYALFSTAAAIFAVCVPEEAADFIRDEDE
ncbi:MAG: hypothetical protein FWF77_06410 [Defluviitaleaceae bacterium]|nr:hypothetical protein [Defluviitaleaceae bacterium]